jgi:hypothetical protein
MKGQLSYVIKPIMLIVTIILVIFFTFSFYGSTIEEKRREKSLDLTAMATNVLLILANSEDCLAYQAPITQGAYANIISIEKIEEFSEKYKEEEPECARSFDFGWRVNISEIDLNGNVVKSWSFGAKDFSHDKKEEINFWIPVAIRYDSKDIRPGKMQIKIVYGELESIAGFFDMVCKTKTSKKIEISLEDDVKIQNDKICINNRCRRLYCNVTGINEIKRGEYILSASYSQGKIFVTK